MQKGYYMIFISVVFTFVSQVLFKKIAVSIIFSQFSLNEITSLLNILLVAPIFYMAIIFHGLAAVFWLYGIKSIELSSAYSMASLNYVFVGIYSVMFLHEEFTVVKLIACIFVILGILLLTKTNKTIQE